MSRSAGGSTDGWITLSRYWGIEVSSFRVAVTLYTNEERRYRQPRSQRPLANDGDLVGAARVRARARSAGLDDVELARLDVAGDALGDLPLRGVGLAFADLPRAQPPELEDLEHVDQVDARGQSDRAETGHHERPAPVEVAGVVGIGDEAQRDREARHGEGPGVQVEHGAAL